MIAFITIVAVLAFLTCYSAFSWGLVLYYFWPWFVLPIFPNMPHLTMFPAIGLMLFISLFRNHGSASMKDEYTDHTKTLTHYFIAPWLTLLMGWFIHAIIY